MAMQHDYHTRVQTANAQERLRLAEDEAAKEAAALRARNVAIQRAKEEQEAEHERILRKLDETHQVSRALAGERSGDLLLLYAVCMADLQTTALRLVAKPEDAGTHNEQDNQLLYHAASLSSPGSTALTCSC